MLLIMALPRFLLPVLLGLLMIDASIEFAFISYMVSWLHHTAGGDFEIIAPSTSDKLSFPLHGKPEVMYVNQGHTSNAAAGTAFVLVGIGGIISLMLRHHWTKKGMLGTFVTASHQIWILTTILSALLTLAALIYTFVLTKLHSIHHINLDVAVSLDNRPYPNYVAYPLDQWTPETWFVRVLELQLVYPAERNDIVRQLRIMRAWRWNLIPMFILGLGLCVIAVWDGLQGRKRYAVARPEEFELQKGRRGQA